ncbi:MAG: phage holin family protein [Burkholderiales bacterium]|nr:phage holin family protein [Burkholderiales bacterium]
MTDTPPPGVKEALGALGADLAALARVRLELVAIELKEASQRQKRMLQFAVVAALFLAAGLLALGVLVVVVFWDTYRVAAIAAVCVAYLGIGAWAFLRLRDIAENSPPPFAATIAELERDIEMIRGPE